MPTDATVTSSFVPCLANGGSVAVTVTAATFRSDDLLLRHLDAEAPHHREDRLLGEGHRHVVARPAQAGDQSEADELVVPRSADIGQVAEVLGACGQGEGEGQREESGE